MSERPNLPAAPPIDDEFVDEVLNFEESNRIEIKRIAGDKLTRVLETIVAFANTDGGYLILGLEDPDKGKGRDRVYGIPRRNRTILMHYSISLRRRLRRRLTHPIFPTSAALCGTAHGGASPS